MGNGKVRSVGVAMAMQGSGISGVDVGSASVRLDDGGGYTLTIGSADMGTGCDTILSQMAAENLECSVEEISVYAADTDVSPYDSGSYASSTTYVTGRAVQQACEKLRQSMCRAAALFWMRRRNRFSLTAASSWTCLRERRCQEKSWRIKE